MALFLQVMSKYTPIRPIQAILQTFLSEKIDFYIDKII
jgi:hypothetical protein